MRTSTPILAAVLALALLAATSADDRADQQPTLVEKAAVAAASNTSTADRTAFDFEWYVDQNGLVPVDIAAEGETLTPEEDVPVDRNATVTDLLSLVGRETGDDDWVSCTITATGVVQSLRSFRALVTDHLADVTWTVDCEPRSGTAINVATRNYVYDLGLRPLGGGQHETRNPDASGLDKVAVWAETPLPVGLFEADNVHGDGSDRGMDLSAEIEIEDVWSGVLCLETYGRQGTGIRIAPVECMPAAPTEATP